MQYVTNFLTSISGHLTGVLGAIVTLCVGLIVADLVRGLVVRMISRSGLTAKLNLGADGMRPEVAIGKLIYYLLVLMVLMIVLEMMGVSNVLEPLKNMASKFFAFIPNVIAAGIIGYVGYILATLASNVVGMSSDFFQPLMTRFNVSPEFNVMKLVKQIVFIFIFIPVLIAALDALKITAISEPAKNMLNTFINAIPNIIAAVVLITVFYIGGKYLSTLLRDLLTSLKTDELGQKLGLTDLFGADFSIAKTSSNFLFAFIVLGGAMAGMEKLGLSHLSGLMTGILHLCGKIALGLAIIVAGTFASNQIFSAMAKNEESRFMASIARVAAMALFIAMGLRSMGIANDIVSLAFTLLIGSVAVAIAVAFGMGGRETAAKMWADFYNKVKK
ncbi:MAG: hypothetical protein RL329_2904 [Bacteroidota bacterium]|jgi:hypothetical protein